MYKYFNIFLEFDRNKLEEKIINTSLSGKGYCCFVDHVLLVESYREKDGKLKEILNNALVNSCDGSYIAFMASLIYKKKYKAYNGPELFNKYILFPDKQCIVGSSREVFNKIKMKLKDSEHDSSNLHFIHIPHLQVDQFDYISISKEINKIGPRFIWVSLGAPKQEEFMYRILPNIDKGIMLGVGAALNYFSGEINDIPNWAIKMHLIWLYRIFTEPKKQIPRCLSIFINAPRIFLTERYKVKNKH